LTPENVRAGGEFAFYPEIDRILLGGIHLGRDGQLKALKQVQQLMPALGVEAIDARMQRIAADGIPTWLKAEEFWTAEMDDVLLTGIRQGRVGERNAVAKILRLCPGLRTATSEPAAAKESSRKPPCQPLCMDGGVRHRASACGESWRIRTCRC